MDFADCFKHDSTQKPSEKKAVQIFLGLVCWGMFVVCFGTLIGWSLTGPDKSLAPSTPTSFDQEMKHLDAVEASLIHAFSQMQPGTLEEQAREASRMSDAFMDIHRRRLALIHRYNHPV